MKYYTDLVKVFIREHKELYLLVWFVEAGAMAAIMYIINNALLRGIIPITLIMIISLVLVPILSLYLSRYQITILGWAMDTKLEDANEAIYTVPLQFKLIRNKNGMSNVAITVHVPLDVLLTLRSMYKSGSKGFVGRVSRQQTRDLSGGNIDKLYYVTDGVEDGETTLYIMDTKTARNSFHNNKFMAASYSKVL